MEGVDDVAEFNDVRSALSDVGIAAEVQQDMFRCVSQQCSRRLVMSSAAARMTRGVSRCALHHSLSSSFVTDPCYHSPVPFPPCVCCCSVLSGLMHLGNVRFTENAAGESQRDTALQQHLCARHGGRCAPNRMHNPRRLTYQSTLPFLAPWHFGVLHCAGEAALSTPEEAAIAAELLGCPLLPVKLVRRLMKVKGRCCCAGVDDAETILAVLTMV